MAPKQILLIDSDKHIRESLNTFFKNGENSFLIFKTATEGLNALAYQKIDIVIADYFLPDMDGVRFLVKAKERVPDLVRILMTTIVNEDLKDEIRKAGIDALLEKPINITILDNLILEIGRANKNPDRNGVR